MIENKQSREATDINEFNEQTSLLPFGVVIGGWSSRRGRSRPSEGREDSNWARRVDTGRPKRRFDISRYKGLSPSRNIGLGVTVT
jgi:hypothetical protein